MPSPPRRSGSPVRPHSIAPTSTLPVIVLIAVSLVGISFGIGLTQLAYADTPSQPPSTVASDITVEYIAQKLATRVQDVIDITAQVAFVQNSPRNDSRSEGELQLKALFPDLVRAVWTSPDFLSGLLWILDTQRDRFTQYQPTTGEARHHPLSDVIADQTLIPITPEQLFSLPSNDQYELEIAQQPQSASEPPTAVVRAVDTISGKEYRVWVNMEDWIITRIESLSATGRVELSAWVQEIHINQGLSAAELRDLPPGTVERHLP